MMTIATCQGYLWLRRNLTSDIFRLSAARRKSFIAAAAALFIAAAFFPSAANAVVNCAAKPSACGYPDETNTGVRPYVKLKAIPGSATSGPGWHWTSSGGGGVVIDGDGAVFSGYAVNATIDVMANDVLIENVRVSVGGNTFGIAIRHAQRTVILDSEITSPVASNRLLVGIKDIYGDARGTRVLRNEITNTSTGIQLYEGVIRDNYVHRMGRWSGDHINGIMANENYGPIIISHNTVFNQYGQTDAIGLFEDFGTTQRYVTIENNLVAGGGYSIYGGQNPGGPLAHHIKIINNRFSKKFFPRSGYWGPVAAYNSSATGNVFLGNVWDDTNGVIKP